MATEGKNRARRTWEDFCELQGLPRSFDLPGLSIRAKYSAVGNGVPVYVAKTVALAIAQRHEWRGARLCLCGCGRPLDGGHVMATAACRKRMQRQRDRVAVIEPGTVTPGASRSDGGMSSVMDDFPAGRGWVFRGFPK